VVHGYQNRGRRLEVPWDVCIHLQSRGLAREIVDLLNSLRKSTGSKSNQARDGCGELHLELDDDGKKASK